MSKITFANGTVDREAALRSYVHTVTSGQDSSNAAAIDIGLGSTATVVVMHAQVESTTGVFRNPQGVVSVSGSTVTVNDSGLAVSEKVHIVAVGYAG